MAAKADGPGTEVTWFREPAVRIAASYLGIAMVWIGFSDLVVEWITDDARSARLLQTLKGWGWVTLSAWILYVMVRRALSEARQAREREAEERSKLDLMLRQLPALLWTSDTELVITSSVGAALPLIGRRPNEAVGASLSDRLRDSPERPEIIAAARAALQGQEASYLVTLNGRVFDTTCVPLRNDSDEIVGIMGLAIDVTDAKRAETELTDSLVALGRSTEQRDRLVRHLVRAEEDERERIASGIHDDSIQVMTSAAMALDLLVGRTQERDSRELAERARDLTRDAIRRLRGFAFELKPVELEEAGLGAALRLALERATLDHQTAFELRDETTRDLPRGAAYLTYRVAQEAIQNSRKHANASVIKVHLREQEGGVVVSISDDGVGFDTNAAVARDHFGLADMRQRAELTGGWFRLESQPGIGTTVEYWVPASPSAGHPGAFGVGRQGIEP